MKKKIFDLEITYINGMYDCHSPDLPRLACYGIGITVEEAIQKFNLILANYLAIDNVEPKRRNVDGSIRGK
jgi:hypothetical protein